MTVHRRRHIDPARFGDRTRPRCPVCDRLFHPDVLPARTITGDVLPCADCQGGVVI